MNKLTSEIRIGTSGIVVPGKKEDYPEEYKSKSRLQYYSSLYNTVEINSSFHKIPMPKTFGKWAAEVSDGFKFTIKLWRGITHSKKLDFQIEDIDFFMEAASNIGIKKGCLLIQFPASIQADYLQSVEKVLQRIAVIDRSEWEVCLELRHNSWYQQKTYEMLNRYLVALVFHDIAASKTPFIDLDSKTIYFRFHGPKGDYRGSYSDEFLQEYAGKIKYWRNKGKEVYAYFNNTMGNALENSQLLQRMVEIKHGS